LTHLQESGWHFVGAAVAANSRLPALLPG